MPSTLPRTVERVGRVSGKGWPALAGGLPYHHHLREWKRDGEEDEAGRMTDSPRRCPVVAVCWSIGGEVVEMWWRLHRPELDEVAARPSP